MFDIPEQESKQDSVPIDEIVYLGRKLNCATSNT
jgi:hypothetical protein